MRIRKNSGHARRATNPCVETHASARGEDLLPWADPYVTNLLREHRLQTAVNDSLNYLAEAREQAVSNGGAWRR